MKPHDFLKLAGNTLSERGATRDKGAMVLGEYERSMPQIVKVFRALTGIDLTERQGWTFMVVLKLVREQRSETFQADNYVDLIGYAALLGESREREFMESKPQPGPVPPPSEQMLQALKTYIPEATDKVLLRVEDERGEAIYANGKWWDVRADQTWPAFDVVKP